MGAAGLVVGARFAGSSEPLLGHNGAGRFVVDVEVSGAVAQVCLGLLDDFPVVCVCVRRSYYVKIRRERPNGKKVLESSKRLQNVAD